MSDFDTISGIGKHLSDEFRMDTEDIAEMVEVLFESVEKQIAEIQIKLNAGDFDGVRQSGHAIKGAAANVGAKRISEIGKSLEEAGESSDTEKCSELLTQLQTSFAALKTSS